MTPILHVNFKLFLTSAYTILGQFKLQHTLHPSSPCALCNVDTRQSPISLLTGPNALALSTEQLRCYQSLKTDWWAYSSDKSTVLWRIESADSFAAPWIRTRTSQAQRATCESTHAAIWVSLSN